MTETIRVAAVQMCSGIAPEPNLAMIDTMVAEAVAAGATYVLTPEVCVSFVPRAEDWQTVATPFDGNVAVAACSKIAAAHRVFLHLGSLAIAVDNGRFRNRSVLFGPDGTVVATYDKIHLFDADPPGDRPYRESETFEGGAHAVTAWADKLHVGFAICYDLRFPQLFNTLVGAGATVLALPAAFTVPTGRAHWQALLQARAIETGSFVIAAAQGGAHENGRATYGHSMIVDPWGEIVAEKADDQPGVLVTDIDLAKVQDARARVPALANQRVFSLSVNSVQA